MSLDVIAITNHNLFDMGNYMAIKETLSPNVEVLPGIEVNLEGGHILIISNQDDAELFGFNSKCEAVNERINEATDTLSFREFCSIFPNLNKYVLIPHYDKAPQLPKDVINAFGDYIVAGEVTSVKKFLKKDINNFLKGISEEMPVVISTHNNTIGGSISPDYILYTEKVIENGEAKYKRYSGYATDASLKTVEGEVIDNYQITINSLEAGEEAYQERNTLYGILRNQ